MDLLANWKILFSVFPGLVLFLYGIEHFSVEIQRVAGERFRSLLGKLSNNRFTGAMLGTLVTAVIQSSTATTVIVVGLVNAGTISFAQSLGIIFGANIGTTVTAQLVAFKLTAFAPAFIVLGFIVGIAGGKYKFTGKPIFYFGLVFFSLNLISDSIIPIKNDPSLASFFASLSSLPLAIFVGFIFTVIVQSSSVTSGILVLLADSGMITLNEGIPLLLGAAIGTTTTAILASFRMSLHAKRAATAHVLFNLFGVILLLPFVTPFASLIEGLGGGPGQQLANALTVFRLLFAVIFLILLKPFKSLVERIVTGDEDEILFKTKYLADKLPEDTNESLTIIEKELQHLIDITKNLFTESLDVLKQKKSVNYQRVVKLESLNDFLNGRIETAILELSKRKLNEQDARRTILLVRMSNAIEQLGDTARAFSSTINNMSETRTALSKEVEKNLVEVHNVFQKNLIVLARDIREVTCDEIDEMKNNDRELRELVNEGYSTHLKRIQKTNENSAFINLVSTLEVANTKVRDLRKLSELYMKLVIK